MANTFALLLTVVTLLTGLIWLVDKFKWADARKKARSNAQDQSTTKLDEKTLEKAYPENPIVRNARSLFPVIAFVFILRSFIYEPFQIPSGSMMPTLLIGDFIIVEKFAYGIKDPIWQNKLISVGEPKRGDVAVFKYPKNPRIDFIKRVVGLPGDHIVYKDKRLYLIPACTGSDCTKYKEVDITYEGNQYFRDEQADLAVYLEKLGKVSHKILINSNRADDIPEYYQQTDVPTSEYEWVVPKGHYFMMGDNRDNSKDSRYWGFVPEKNLVGKAVAKWISFEFYRSKDGFLPRWIPSKIRFNRIGSII